VIGSRSRVGVCLTFDSLSRRCGATGLRPDSGRHLSGTAKAVPRYESFSDLTIQRSYDLAKAEQLRRSSGPHGRTDFSQVPSYFLSVRFLYASHFFGTCPTQ
jgi:hypothetical protein